tara:strand:+ start:1549 stop:2451 length:903 start_codon:yes stop_codon:yes gene_type:complete
MSFTPEISNTNTRNRKERRSLKKKETSENLEKFRKDFEEASRAFKEAQQLYNEAHGKDNTRDNLFHKSSTKSLPTIQENKAKIASFGTKQQPQTKHLWGNPITYEGKVFNPETGPWERENPMPTNFAIDSKPQPQSDSNPVFNSDFKDVFTIPELGDIPLKNVLRIPNYKRGKEYPFPTLGFLLRVVVPDGMSPGTAYLHICGMCLRVVPIYKVGHAYVIPVEPSEGWNIVAFSKYAYQEGYRGIKIVTFNENKTTWETGTPWFHPEHLQQMKEGNRGQRTKAKSQANQSPSNPFAALRI